MNLEQLFKLIDAGFTHDEIMQLQAVGDPEPAGDPEPKDASTKIIEGLTSQVAALTKAIHLANIRGTDGAGPKTESVDDILKGMFIDK